MAVSSARVLHGFEEPARTAQEFVARARQAAVFLMPGHIVDEFVLAMLDFLRPLSARGVSQRLLVAGPSDPSHRREFEEAGLEVRVLGEEREVGFLATDQDLLLFPAGQRPDSPLNVVALAVSDPVLVIHFRLAFERAWTTAGSAGDGPPAARSPDAHRR